MNIVYDIVQVLFIVLAAITGYAIGHRMQLDQPQSDNTILFRVFMGLVGAVVGLIFGAILVVSFGGNPVIVITFAVLAVLVFAYETYKAIKTPYVGLVAEVKEMDRNDPDALDQFGSRIHPIGYRVPKN
jgi:ABC-type branched-subunit amino acid transport system permease subunit